MSSQSNKSPELKEANTSKLNELLERGEISPEAFAEYSATADAALSSTLDSSAHTHNTAPTRFVEVDGIRFAYRCCSSTSWATSTTTTRRSLRLSPRAAR